MLPIPEPAVLEAGHPEPLGACYDGMGVNFAVFSESATRILLCLFRSVDDEHEAQCVPLPAYTEGIWHGYLPNAAPGLIYGLRADGPHNPSSGHRFDAQKLLVDPYARALTRTLGAHPAMFAYDVHAQPDVRDLTLAHVDSAPVSPRCVVMPPVDTRLDHRPYIPWCDTVIYETHVKGLTALHPLVPPHLRGTYAALGSPPVIAHLQRLGVTAVELLPVQARLTEPFLMNRGLTNYWGYSTLGYFAPDPQLAADTSPGACVEEFRAMVCRLHAARIEVILDVVYNHTCEGDQFGPTVCFRGLDNAAYYRLSPTDRRFYEDFTGCGNTLNVRHPMVVRLILDSLRYWAETFQIDGFRFDLCTALARDGPRARAPRTCSLELWGQFTPYGILLNAIAQDPVLRRLKLIAEPWDCGPHGFHVGGYPSLWSEWNAHYRDAVRRFWHADGTLSELATRVAGSADLFARRGPRASVHFITCHDGFTLQDLVSYRHKHNEANGEANRDGNDHNISQNCGWEGLSGPGLTLGIAAQRAMLKRALWATMMLSVGVPMMSGGDELSRTQQGNNNAYCQDNTLSYYDWDPAMQLDSSAGAVSAAGQAAAGAGAGSGGRSLPPPSALQSVTAGPVGAAAATPPASLPPVSGSQPPSPTAAAAAGVTVGVTSPVAPLSAVPIAGDSRLHAPAQDTLADLVAAARRDVQSLRSAPAVEAGAVAPADHTQPVVQSWSRLERALFLWFAQYMARLRARIAALHRRTFFAGAVRDPLRRDVVWVRPQGGEMNESDWHDRCMGYLLDGNATGEAHNSGGPSVFIIVNAASNPVSFLLPTPPVAPTRPTASRAWLLILNTAAAVYSSLTQCGAAADVLIESEAVAARAAEAAAAAQVGAATADSAQPSEAEAEIGSLTPRAPLSAPSPAQPTPPPPPPPPSTGPTPNRSAVPAVELSAAAAAARAAAVAGSGTVSPRRAVLSMVTGAPLQHVLPGGAALRVEAHTVIVLEAVDASAPMGPPSDPFWFI